MPRDTVRPRSLPLLREMLKAKGYSLRDMERRGVKRGMLHRLITDNDSYRKSTCSADLGQRISDALGVPASVLFMPVASNDAGQQSKRAA